MASYGVQVVVLDLAKDQVQGVLIVHVIEVVYEVPRDGSLAVLDLAGLASLASPSEVNFECAGAGVE